MLIGFLAHADIADPRRPQDSLGGFQRAEHKFDGKLAAIFASPEEFNARADLLRQSLRRAARAVGDDPFCEAFGNDVLHPLPYQFIAAGAELLLRSNIDENDFSDHVYD